jgi:hypothetical protein
MEDIQGVSARRVLISRLNFLRSGILAVSLACLPARGFRRRHRIWYSYWQEDKHTKRSHQTAIKQPCHALVDLRGQQAQRAPLRSDQTSTCTLMEMTGHDLAYHWVTLETEPEASSVRSVTTYRGERRAYFWHVNPAC